VPGPSKTTEGSALNGEGGAEGEAEGAAKAPGAAEDAALVERAAGGDPDAFGQLFERRREGLYLKAYSYLRRRDDALDVVQEAFMRAWERLGGFRGESSFATWMGRIVTNLCIDRIRRPKTVSGGLDEDVLGEPAEDPRLARAAPRASSPVRAAELAEFAPALHSALGELSEKHRSVFLLHAQDGLRYREIADELGISIGTVMSRLHYAREKLQEMLAPHLEGEG